MKLQTEHVCNLIAKGGAEKKRVKATLTTIHNIMKIDGDSLAEWNTKNTGTQLVLTDD